MENREKQITRVTLAGAVVNVALTVVKLIAGFFGNSTAMIADGIHSLSDLVSDVIVVFFVSLSSKGRDERHDYGHGKFETLATLIVGLLLALVSINLVWYSFSKIKYILSEGVDEQPTLWALAVALISILAKELLFRYTMRCGVSLHSEVLKANAWHHRTDSFSSVGAFIGILLAILLGEGWTVLDPLVCLFIGIYILVVAVKMLIPVFDEFMEVSLSAKEEHRIESLIASVEGVENVHGMKTRRNGPYIIIDVHVVVCSQMTVSDAHEITVEAEGLIKQEFGETTQINIHVEPTKDAL